MSRICIELIKRGGHFEQLHDSINTLAQVHIRWVRHNKGQATVFLQLQNIFILFQAIHFDFRILFIALDGLSCQTFAQHNTY